MQELKKIEIINGLMNMEQAAGYLNIKRSTLYDLTMRRKIACVKVGRLNRFRLQDLDAWIESRLREARPNPGEALPTAGGLA